MAEQNRRLLIIRNPVSGFRNKSRFETALQMLTEKGCEVFVETTSHSLHAFEIAKTAIERPDHWSAIVAAGGDGTISEVANGMRGSEISMGVIPLGTSNVFAREVGVGLNLVKVTNILASATPVPIYPGLIAGQRFMLMVGAGYDSFAVSSLDPLEKKRFGAFAYIIAALRSLKHFKLLNVDVLVDGQVFSGTSVVVSRSRLFGGPFVVAPHGNLQIPGFQVLVLKGRGIGSVLKYGLALVTNRIWKLNSVDYLQTTGPVEIIATPSIPWQRDGDAGDKTPEVLTVDEMPLNILAAFPSIAIDDRRKIFSNDPDI